MGRVQIKGGGLWGVGSLVLVGLLCLMDGIYLWEPVSTIGVDWWCSFYTLHICALLPCLAFGLLGLGWFGFGLVEDEMRWVHLSRLQRWMDGWREWWDGFVFACNTPCALELLYRRWDGEAGEICLVDSIAMRTNEQYMWGKKEGRCTFLDLWFVVFSWHVFV